MRFGRRHFLMTSGLALSAAGISGQRIQAAEEPARRPPVDHPRQTAGDTRHEPAWSQGLTVTVGPADADIVGNTDRALQAAVDYVARLGGGTVRVLPGTYKLRNAVYLASKIRLVGAGLDTVLIKEPSITTRLAADSDWYDQEITLEDAAGFRVGDGICLRTKNPHDGGTDIAKRTLVAQDGRRFKLDRALWQNFWQMGDTTVSTLFPLLSGEFVEDIELTGLALDGNKSENANLDGNYAGCVFLQDCNRVSMRELTGRNNNGDALSWQICHDVTVEDCHLHDNVGLGLHPGSGSQRPTIRRNLSENNDIGLFFCWGVKYGLAEENRLIGNRVGISIGHRDTDNLCRANLVQSSKEVGVLFRPERGQAFAPHRNRLEENTIVDSGTETGIAIDIQGQVQAIELVRNQLQEKRQPMARVGIRIGDQAEDIRLVENQIDGFATAIKDMRSA